MSVEAPRGWGSGPGSTRTTLCPRFFNSIAEGTPLIPAPTTITAAMDATLELIPARDLVRISADPFHLFAGSIRVCCLGRPLRVIGARFLFVGIQVGRLRRAVQRSKTFRINLQRRLEG